MAGADSNLYPALYSAVFLPNNTPTNALPGDLTTLNCVDKLVWAFASCLVDLCVGNIGKLVI